MVQLFI